MEHANVVKYEEILGKSFCYQERKTVGWCANILVFFIIISTVCNIFKPHRIIDFAPSPTYSKTSKGELVCESKRFRSKICYAKGDIRVLGNLSTILVVSNEYTNMSWNIKPYAREGAPKVRNIMIKKVHFSHHQQIRHCTKHYNVPAIIFSTGGFVGNHFHDFTDLLIPLYLTSQEFEGEVQFLVTDRNPTWIESYVEVIQRLSKYDIIYLDGERGDNENDVFCFSRMIVGLKANKEFSLDVVSTTTSGNPPSFSMRNFTAFLRRTYGLKRESATKLVKSTENDRPSPRLLIIARNKTRRFLNTDEISSMARGVGFEVVVQEFAARSSIKDVSKFVNGFDVMVGVHGAGFSNMVFLPEKAVVVQVVGLGMEWLASVYFELPSLDMGLRYLDYKVCVNESSLGDQVPKNPIALDLKQWIAFKERYMDHQEVKLDVTRFRKTIINALELLYV